MAMKQRHELRRILRLIREKMSLEGVSTVDAKASGIPYGKHIIDAYRQSNTMEISSKTVHQKRQDATALLEFLNADVAHKKLAMKLFPGSTMTAAEKLKRTASAVGLALPKEANKVEQESVTASSV